MVGSKEVLSNDSLMNRVTTKQAAKELNMDLDTLQYLMRKGQLPIGHAVLREGKKRTTYYIYRGMLDTYKKQICGS